MVFWVNPSQKTLALHSVEQKLSWGPTISFNSIKKHEAYLNQLDPDFHLSPHEIVLTHRYQPSHDQWVIPWEINNNRVKCLTTKGYGLFPLSISAPKTETEIPTNRSHSWDKCLVNKSNCHLIYYHRPQKLLYFSTIIRSKILLTFRKSSLKCVWKRQTDALNVTQSICLSRSMTG